MCLRWFRPRLKTRLRFHGRILSEDIMLLGDFKIQLLPDGDVLVDGGTMFGAIPKTIWSRLVECDGRNRILLAMNCLLVETPEKRILIEAGAGAECAADAKRLDEFVGVKGMRRRIEDAGLKVGDIDMVIFSHLHYDHVGGVLENIGGEMIPVFPKAEYVVQAGEWRDAFNTNEFTKDGYDERALTALKEARRMRLIEGDAEICPGVRALVTGGHTAFHQIIMIESQGKKAAFLGDLIPTAAHVPLAHIMALDVSPLQALEAKRRFLRQAAAENILCFFSHERGRPAGYVRSGEGGYFLEERRDG